VFSHFRRLRLRGRWTVLFTAFHDAERQRLGRNPHASAAIMDVQPVKTVEESAHTSGFDAHKRVKGRKRHLLVDTLGIPLSYYGTPAELHETQGARRLLGGLNYFVPQLKTIWADSANRGKELVEWCKAIGDWDLEVVERTPGTRGFAVQPNR
jgi:putative transposase